ncbi:MAG TPA: undecaprenyl-diphosphate phosphatase [Candidatus Andersenbacteria bacterium]|nr:undecaprenyl-diphosphate phosphatase [Candidatus Andersenbacteria bacterium]
MITLFQAIILGALQGITELFPISSLGHSVIFPALFGWNDLQNDPFFLNFLVGTHLATAVVLIGFYWNDWVNIIKGFFRSLFTRSIIRNDSNAKIAWLLIIGTIPAGLLGLIFEHKLRTLFAIPSYAALFLIINGIVLYIAELIPKKTGSRISEVTFKQAFLVGCAQIVALFPGFSRTGATITGGLFAGLTHLDAVRYSFLLATPIIFAAAVLKLPALIYGAGEVALIPTVIGALTAGIAAYGAIKYLTNFFRTNTLKPFAIYCIIAGVLASIILLVR